KRDVAVADCDYNIVDFRAVVSFQCRNRPNIAKSLDGQRQRTVRMGKRSRSEGVVRSGQFIGMLSYIIGEQIAERKVTALARGFAASKRSAVRDALSAETAEIRRSVFNLFGPCHHPAHCPCPSTHVRRRNLLSRANAF